MKRGPSVLPPASPTKSLVKTLRREEEEEERRKSGPFLSPFPSATSLFSPDVSSKMASDLLIRLSEATQKARAQPGGRVQPEPQHQEVRGGQQDEPGLALSPDGPGASPEPPSLSHTPESNSGTETLASDLLRKLAERQEVNHSQSVQVKEEEEPMEVDSLAAFDLNQTHRPITEHVSLLPQTHMNLFNLKTEEGGSKTANSPQTGAKMSADHILFGLNNFYTLKQNTFEVKVKQEDGGVSGAKMVEQLLSTAKMDDLFKPKVPHQHFNGAKKSSGFSGVKSNSALLIKTEEPLFLGVKMEEQFGGTGAKMADQCLRAVLWQDMSVNLASTLLHQLSERVSKSNPQMVERTPTPVRTSPALVLKVEQSSSPPLTTNQPLPETSLRRDQTTGGAYFYRCHVCGFETEGRSLFQGHMSEHRQWERSLFSLHCCACDASAGQEGEMKAHVDTHHLHRDAQAQALSRCPPAPPAVAVETPPESSAHRCRICQRSFPGQQELLVHFQGHRQGNQYRCDRCGHLTRTANKLVEHVRVHTGERPFTCALCPYSAKRRDSLRLHCKVKHPSAVHALTAHVHANGLVHTPGQAHRDTPLVHAQRLLAPLPPPPFTPLPLDLDQPQWRDLSPLLPITVLLNIRPRPPDLSDQSQPSSDLPDQSQSSSDIPDQSQPSSYHPDQSQPSSGLFDQSQPSSPAASSCKRSYMRYLGLSSL